MIGAGSSGIAACQVLASRGIDFECFEVGSAVGGNWRYENDNGMSSAYRSLHINTSRRTMAYSTYPMPEDYPDYPSHFQIAAYFDDFVDHFGFRDRIRFNHEVTDVSPAEPRNGGAAGYRVSWRDGDGNEDSGLYSSVLVANGHHWDARWPDPPFPGQDSFTGEQLHVHDYRETDVLTGKRVLVLGIGNSATDIAVESSRIADKTFIAMRRSAYIIPKYVRGHPTDEAGAPGLLTRLPLTIQRALFKNALKAAAGMPTDYGLPEPDHKLLEAHPTVSSELLPRIGHGDVTVKPNIARFDGSEVVFDDGSREQVDLVVYCTGYKITFPFFDPGFVAATDNRLDLYRRVVHPDNPGLYFIGLLQPLGAIMPLAEAQSEWVADVLEGKVSLPSSRDMHKVIERESDRMAKRYVASKRHTIQVDFHPYLRTLARERRAGRARVSIDRLRARRSHELRRV